MRFFTTGLIAATALVGASLAGVEAASAMPVAPATDAADAAAPIETVGWRCGPGWHVNPWGRCVPNGYGYGAYGGYYGARPLYRPYARPYYRPYARPYYRPYARPYYRRW